MNFFFAIEDRELESILTVPKFKNSGKKNNKINLYEAKIENRKWHVILAKCEENDDFFMLNKIEKANEKIFFLAEESDLLKLQEKNFSCLLDLNNFTNTFPEFRANLCLKNKFGGFSSYQSEYPFQMINKKGSILSPATAMYNSNSENKIFFKNIYHMPEQKEFLGYFVDFESKKIIKKFNLITNFTNEIILDEPLKKNLYFLTREFLGIPVYVSKRNEEISCEHTHPPHEYILSDNRFEVVKNLKKEINDIFD